MYLKVIEKQVVKKAEKPKAVLKREWVYPLPAAYESYHFAKDLYGGFDGDPKMPANCIGLIRWKDHHAEDGFICHYITNDQEAYIVDDSGKTVDQFTQWKIEEMVRDLYYSKEIDALVDLWASVTPPVIIQRIKEHYNGSDVEIIEALKPILRQMAYNKINGAG